MNQALLDKIESEQYRKDAATFGVGEDFDEALLRRMADAGGGNFQFIESSAQIADLQKQLVEAKQQVQDIAGAPRAQELRRLAEGAGFDARVAGRLALDRAAGGRAGGDDHPRPKAGQRRRRDGVPARASILRRRRPILHEVRPD